MRSPTQSVWVAERQDGNDRKVVGVLVLHHHPKALRIYSLAVLPQCQGLGVGHSLMEHAREVGRKTDRAALTLEVDERDTKLVEWYKWHGFRVEKQMEDYYAMGWGALRMRHTLLSPAVKKPPSEDESPSMGIRNLIVMDDPGLWKLDIDSVEIVSAKDYLSEQKYQDIKSARIFNLCKSYRYQSFGYYVSLLAAARDHRPIPSVTTIEDFRCQTIMQSITYDIDELIQKILSRQGDNRKEATLHIYFGHTVDPRMRKLGHELYRLFEAPLMRVHFAFMKKWLVQQIVPLAMKAVPAEDIPHIPELARMYFSRKRFHSIQLKQYSYDLAILVDPEEKCPPSCPRALRHFKKAAEKLNFCVEFVGKDDFSRIGEFDGLFIRETTAVDHHTYRFARKAYAEGLVVIDDPWSILRCANKVYLNERLEQSRVPSPKTWTLYKESVRDMHLDWVTYPLVLKQPDSAFSKGVVKVHNEVELHTELNRLFKISDLLIAQEFVPSEFDWRIGVLDCVPLFACKYYMAKDHWQIVNWNSRSARHHYGDFKTLKIEDVPAKVIETAVKAASLIGDGLYGVDLKQHGEKVSVIEVNDNPNIDGGVEDLVLKDEIYLRIMKSFQHRIEVARNIPNLPAFPLINKLSKHSYLNGYHMMVAEGAEAVKTALDARVRHR